MLSGVVELSRANRLPRPVARHGLPGPRDLSPPPFFPEPNFSSRNLHRWRSTRRAHGAAKPELARPFALGPVVAARWTARILGTLFILLVLPFILAEGLPPIASTGGRPTHVHRRIPPLSRLRPRLVARRHRRRRHRLRLDRRPDLRKQIPAGHLVRVDPGCRRPLRLLLVGHPRSTHPHRDHHHRRARRHPRLRPAVRPHQRLPFRHRHGSISGEVLPNAELRLPPRLNGALPSGDSPQARTDAQGRFRLYIGWYSADRPLSISAPGYITLTTNLGPRELGRRSLPRGFSLQPEFTPAIELTLNDVDDARGAESWIFMSVDPST
jgi:hypothetical protein